ncbi:MAG: hypothetical protein M3Y22_03520 [Pseudomonadota bacterium]|nr:hypothetical protein [Pseudomonadota bacterium]
MAKTIDNGCTEAEAAGAAAAVDRLLALYEIDLDEVTLKEQEIIRANVKIDGHPIQFAASMIARFTDCKVWLTAGTTLTFFGFQVDTEIADYLTLVFRRAIDREIATVTLFNADYMGRKIGEQHSFRDSFGRGMAIRLGERLGELKSKRDFTQRTNGRDLVLIKMPLVEAAMRDAGIVLGGARGASKPRDTNAFHAGRAAANTVAINAGIAARAERGGRLR